MNAQDIKVRFFELMRKRQHQLVHWVPTAEESKTMYRSQETTQDGVVNYFPSRSVLRCPERADNIELAQLQATLSANGVEMFL